MDIFKIVKFEHPDGHYFFAYSKNLRNYCFDINRSTNAYNKGNPINHTGVNNLAWYCHHTLTPIADWHMEIVDSSYFRSIARIIKNKLIDNAENKELCLNIRKEHVLE